MGTYLNIGRSKFAVRKELTQVRTLDGRNIAAKTGRDFFRADANFDSIRKCSITARIGSWMQPDPKAEVSVRVLGFILPELALRCDPWVKLVPILVVPPWVLVPCSKPVPPCK